MRPPLAALASAQHGAFSTAQILACYSRGELRARVAAGSWIGVFHGSYRLADAEPTPRLRLAAAGLSIGRPVVAVLGTAAALLGFDVVDDPVTHVAVPPGGVCLRRPLLWPHQVRLPPRDVQTLPCGARTTTPDRTAVDLARALPRQDVLATLDTALSAGRCTTDSLLGELDRHHGLPGVRQARELVPLAEAGPEAPPESMLRLLCHDAGLPRPVVQLPVLDRWGRACRWLDLGWEGPKVGLEYDGKESHDLSRTLRADRRRANFLLDDDWAIFHATDLDIRRPAALLAQVDRALTRRPWAEGRSA